MMRCRDGVQFSVACLLMATLIGITGFIIVYHYVKFERPLQQFAIVIDAGSTQTRSGLFSVNIDLPKLADLADEAIEVDEADELNVVEKSISGTHIDLKRTKPPLSKLLSVTQVGNCVNGGPLASIKSESSAQELVSQCLVKFSNQIRRLEADTNDDDDVNYNNHENAGNDQSLLARKADAGDELSKWSAQVNNRVNSVTHLHMGATAGMRALKELDEQEANRIVRWVNLAVSNNNQRYGPHINKGSVGILEGDDEAKFTWISVNFVCERLSLQLRQESTADLLAGSNPTDYYLYTTNGAGGTHDSQNADEDWSSTGVRRKQELERFARRLRQASELGDVLNSVGTVELGGASAQIAFRVPSWLTSDQVANNSLVGQSFDLFNEKYALATRSDLCLGASQAVLRVEYLLIRELFSRLIQVQGSLESLGEIENPCLQNGARKSFDSKQLLETLSAPCLVPSKSTEFQVQQVKNFLTARGSTERGQQQAGGSIRFLGTGNTKKCGSLLDKLLDSRECRQMFSICPVGSGLRGTGPQKLIQPPSAMPFVTIAGYNKALQVLKLSKGDSELVESETKQVVELELLIAERLGGHSIDYLELVAKTEEFCTTKISELPSKYPLVNNRLMATTCLSLQYIDKILTSYYHFEPKTSWKQLKFLLFPPESSSSSSDNSRDMKKVQPNISANDIGWTLGLLLNATSHLQFQPMFQSVVAGGVDSQPILYHHKASVLFVVRSTIFLMIASVLLVLSILLVAVFAIKQKNSQSSPSSYSAHQGVYQAHSYGGISVVSAGH